MTRRLAVLLLAAASAGCQRESRAEIEAAATRAAITSQIAASIEVMRTKNIDGFMAQLPEDIEMLGPDGAPLTRERYREMVLEAWKSIRETRDLTILVDTIIPKGDSASVITVQHWDRLVVRPDGVTVDTIVTDTRQAETWRRTPSGWRSYQVVRMGSQTRINGELLTEMPRLPVR
jgi:hypothetical protein